MTTDLDPLIRCGGCGHPLAAIVAGLLYIQHRGRKILAGQVISIECDRCSTVWTNPAAQTPAETPPPPPVQFHEFRQQRQDTARTPVALAA